MLFDDHAPMEADARAKVLAKPGTLDQLEAVAAALESHDGPWSADAIKAVVQQTADALGVKIGALLFPLRVAVTGAGHGADLMPALELLGRETVVGRVRHRVQALRSL